MIACFTVVDVILPEQLQCFGEDRNLRVRHSVGNENLLSLAVVADGTGIADHQAYGILRPAPNGSKRRNIATTFAHIHNVRCMRLKMSARDEEPPARLDRAEVTQAEAKAALTESARAMVRLIEERS